MNPKSNPSPLERALKYLSFRPRSEAEIRRYLGSDCTEEIIARLKRLKFIDDVQFARWYADSRSRTRPRSRRLLELELKQKGVTMSDDCVTMNDGQLAQEALQKKKKLNRQQAIRFLQSRGFSWSAIETALKKGYNDPDVS